MPASIHHNQGRFFPQNQFEPLKQKKNFQYDQQLMGQQPSFSPDYLIQSHHQTSFYSIGGYPTTYYNQLAQYDLNPALFMDSNRLDKQYQHQQNWNYWKQQGDMMASSKHARSFPMNYTTGTIYPYEKEAQFIKYPGFDGLGAPRFGARRALNYGRPSNLVSPGWLNSNVANFDDVRRLPLKMRAVFVPSGFLSVQQSCRGPLVRNSINQI
jgi:hypothetical protein